MTYEEKNAAKWNTHSYTVLLRSGAQLQLDGISELRIDQSTANIDREKAWIGTPPLHASAQLSANGLLRFLAIGLDGRAYTKAAVSEYVAVVEGTPSLKEAR